MYLRRSSSVKSLGLAGYRSSIRAIMVSRELGNLEGIVFSFKTIYRIATPVLFGLALMILPATAFSSIPAIVRSLLQNGLVLGILLAMLMENTIRWDRLK